MPSLLYTLQQNKNILMVGQWKHTYDVPNRYGLLSELEAIEQTKNISLYFNKPNTEVFQFNQHVYQLKIRYLRSYKNSGVFEIYVCNKYLTVLDTLWKDYKTYRISSIETYTYIYNPLQLKNRNKQSNSLYCQDESNAYMTFVHYRSHQHMIIRGATQKIKIISIDICQLNTTTYQEESEPPKKRSKRQRNGQ
jgi:hypothetical protein